MGIYAHQTPLLIKKYTKLLPHYSLAIRMDILLYGSCDPGEFVRVYLDEKQYGEYGKKSDTSGVRICSNGGNILKFYSDELILY
jgi:hypothetical protein